MAPMARARWRVGVGTYLLFFLVAVAASPHHHVNGFEDLVFDQPSDSGVVVESDGQPGTPAAPAIAAFRIVDDVPCLACFSSDFAAAPTPRVALARTLEPLSQSPEPASRAEPEPLPRETSSRAPPAAAFP